MYLGLTLGYSSNMVCRMHPDPLISVNSRCTTKWEKKRKRASAQDKEKKAKKLNEIHQKLNPFDVKVTKLKHHVGGRKLKCVTGRPAQSRQAAEKNFVERVRRKESVGWDFRSTVRRK